MVSAAKVSPGGWPPAGWDEVLSLLPGSVRRILLSLPARDAGELRELRLRSRRPLVGVFPGGSAYISPAGRLCARGHEAYVVHEKDIGAFLTAITRASVYAHEREFKEGFLTLRGGHRVGLAGQAVLEKGLLRTFRHVGGFNLRVARECPGAAAPLIPHLLSPSGRVAHTLLVSPPGAGKTTLLRDLARLLSGHRFSLRNGAVEATGAPGWQVAVIDERSELAASWEGIPQLDVGPNTDVIDGLPKAQAIPLALRSLAPEILITDEIGSPEDLAALADAQRCGTTVVATAHGGHAGEVLQRAGPSRGLKWGRIVLLSDRQGPGTIEEVVSLD